MNFLNKASFTVLAAAVLVCLGFIIYFASLPTPNANFSEFYVLNEDGKPFDYPVQASVNQPVYVTLGIVNQEAKATAYTVRIISGGAIIKSVETGNVGQGQKWEAKADFIPGAPGAGRQIEFYLHIAGEESPHIRQPLVISLDVKGQ